MLVMRHLALAVFASTAIACSSASDGAQDAGADEGLPDAGPFDAGHCSTKDGEAPVDAPGTASGPTLSLLSVITGGGSSSALVPGFSPDVYDYYVRCAAGTNDLTVSVNAPAGAKGSLAIETPGGSSKPVGSTEAEQTLSLMVSEGQAVVATATDGKASQEYWVRCLPHDFSEMVWDAHGNGCTRTPGYYLLGNNWPVAMQPVAYAMVLDPEGVPVWYHRQADTLKGEGVYDIDSLSSGTISFIASPSSQPWQIQQLSPSKMTTVGVGGPLLDDHELRLLPNGNYLFFTIPIETGIDLTGLSLVTGQALGPNSNIASCAIQEVDPASGSTVWTWDVADHFDPAKDTTYATTGAANWVAPDGGPVYDLFHCNSIDVDPASGNLLVSARNLDSVFYIDRATSKVLWKMGGPSASKDNASYVPVADPFHRQHDARLLPGWSPSCGGRGQISMFDDESAEAAHARGIVYDVDVGQGTGCGAAVATVAWQYAGTVNSQYMGSFRVASDGSRVIDWGTGGERGRIFTEVDLAGNDLLDLYFLPGGESYRTVKLPLGAFSLSVLRSTSGQ
jgi:arylsulfotransferase ASST